MQRFKDCFIQFVRLDPTQSSNCRNLLLSVQWE